VSAQGAPLIAVVDDDEAVCEGISSELRSAGYRCATFGSAETFLTSGVALEIDCILLDIRLPGMSGLDLHLELNRINCAVPVLYLTAASEDALRQRALSQGAIAVLTKSFQDNDLLNAISSALDGRSLGGSDSPSSQK
jgi:FixJ family two-component response regulator